jgi:hypothetical protein
MYVIAIIGRHFLVIQSSVDSAGLVAILFPFNVVVPVTFGSLLLDD